ncbi:MAG: adenosylcobinamide-GDP ribazoletransferase [Dehalococcoidia bacterium]|nr:MAG: adenosylcobinamide-GDP ribazoletransferase [Dehalococcoidia bacterium]
MGFLAALEFLTVIPSPLRREATPMEIGRSLVYFPLIGLGLGGALYGLDRLFALFLPMALGSVLIIVALILLTGANHLDGFIDTCDGMAAGRSPQQRLEIMHDSRAGGFGVVGACSLLLVKSISLIFVPAAFRMAALLLMPTLSRWAIVYAVFAYPSARREGIGQIFKEQANWQSMTIATLIALAISVLLMKLLGLALMAGIWLVAIIMAIFLKRRLGGLTGDTYGAINEVIEVLVLILVPLIYGGYL